MSDLQAKLDAYQKDKNLTTKGKLAAILYVSRLANKFGLPLDSSVLVTDSQGQVLGLGKAAVQAILKDHGETRVLAEEGGAIRDTGARDTGHGQLGNAVRSGSGVTDWRH